MNELRSKIKGIMIENLMLPVGIDEIGDDVPLFGPGGLGLDSVDALQLVVTLDKTFGLKISDPAAARTVLANVNSICGAVEKHLQETPARLPNPLDASSVASEF